MEPGSPEDNVIKMLDNSADNWSELFFHLVQKAANHPYFGVAVLAVVVYLVVAGLKGKGKR